MNATTTLPTMFLGLMATAAFGASAYTHDAPKIDITTDAAGLSRLLDSQATNDGSDIPLPADCVRKPHLVEYVYVVPNDYYAAPARMDLDVATALVEDSIDTNDVTVLGFCD